MKEDLKILAERIILTGEQTDRLEKEHGVRVQSFKCCDGCVFINLLSGIEKLANIYSIKNIMIEDGIVRAETEDVSFYQFVMPDKRNEVFEALKLLWGGRSMNKYIFPLLLIALDLGAAIVYGINGDEKK